MALRGKTVCPFPASRGHLLEVNIGRLLTASMLLIWFLALSNISPMFGQADVANSTLNGRIIDQSDAAVVHATISVTSDRGLLRTVMSDDQGRFRVPLLQPGKYSIRVEADGFQTHVIKDVILTLGQIAVTNVQLQVGTLSEQIEVSA